MLSLGLFANGTYGEGFNGVKGAVTGLFYGDAGQFLAEAIGTVANIVYVGAVAALSFWVIGKVLGGNRVPLEDEVNGLDMPEMGVQGYSTDIGPLPTGLSPVPSAEGAVAVSKPAPSF